MEPKLCLSCQKKPRAKERTICESCIYQRRKKYHISYRSSERGKRAVQKYQHNLRKRVIEFLGGKCSLCGYSDIRALQIDHIDGGGTKANLSVHWRKRYAEILQGIHPHKTQILCANCNWIKRHENRECSKKV